MGLMPDQFWHLTVREFWLKWAAFDRAEDRRRALMFEQALTSGAGDQKQRMALERAINSLRRYPIKPWLFPPREA